MNAKDPAAVGFPEIEPDEGFSVSPRGSLPERMAKLYGADPPFTEITALYALPIVAGGK
jgi:hypothetical protein